VLALGRQNLAAAPDILKRRTADCVRGRCPLRVAVLGADGVTTFAALQDALSRGQAERLTYHIFDLLHLDGCDLTSLP